MKELSKLCFIYTLQRALFCGWKLETNELSADIHTTIVFCTSSSVDKSDLYSLRTAGIL